MAHKIAFREYGHGPLLVLLHGYGGSVMHWDPVVGRLKDHHRVVVPNLTHLFLSKDRLLFPVIVELLAEFVRLHFPGEKVSVAGTSFGGAVAWGLAAQHPDLIERVLLFNPLMPHPIPNFRLPETRYFFVSPMDAKSVLRVFETPIGQSFLKRCAEIFRPDRATAERSLARLQGTKLAFVAGLIAHFAWILRNEDWRYWQMRISAAKIPILMAWAKDDQLFDDKAYREFAESLALARFEELAAGGHILSKSQPDVVAQLCLEFLAKPAAPKKSAA